MGDYDELGPGEIRRGFDRLEKQLGIMQADVSQRYSDLANKMNVAIGPVSELRYRADANQKDMDEVCGKVRELEQAQTMAQVRSAGVAGGVAVILFIIKFIIWK